MYREVTMIEVKEVLRLRGEGLPKKRIAAQLGLDPKTVRRYLAAAATAGVRVTATISDEEVRQVLLALHPDGRSAARRRLGAVSSSSAPAIERWLGDGLRLTKIRKLLVRQGVEIAYPTLHRFAVLELQFGKTATTIPVLDGEPGQELQVDTGWVGWLTLPAAASGGGFARGSLRRCARATASSIRPSRKRPRAPSRRVRRRGSFSAASSESSFRITPRRSSSTPIRSTPRITPAFLEYAQARHFHIDPARVRHAPRQRARRARRARRPRRLLRRRSAHDARRRARVGPALVPQ